MSSEWPAHSGRLELAQRDSDQCSAEPDHPKRCHLATTSYLRVVQNSRLAVCFLASGTAVGEAAFEAVEFTRDSIIIGRDPGCEQPLDNPMISWHHARLQRTPEGTFVEDLGSLNGTFVDGIRISGRVQITPGQEVALGQLSLSVNRDRSVATSRKSGQRFDSGGGGHGQYFRRQAAAGSNFAHGLSLGTGCADGTGRRRQDDLPQGAEWLHSSGCRDRCCSTDRTCIAPTICSASSWDTCRRTTSSTRSLPCARHSTSPPSCAPICRTRKLSSASTRSWTSWESSTRRIPSSARPSARC